MAGTDDLLGKTRYCIISRSAVCCVQPLWKHTGDASRFQEAARG